MSIEILQEKIRKKKNPTVLGLDPRPEYIPQSIVDKHLAALGSTPEGMAAAYTEFCCGLIDALEPIVPAVKPQAACFEVLGHHGVKALEDVTAYAKQHGMYVIMDAKRGDIGVSAESYARAYIGKTIIGDVAYAPFDADAVTVNGYLGSDGITPFTDICKSDNKAIFLLVKTSNKSSREVQDLIVGDRLMYVAMADLAMRLSSDLYGASGYSAIGAVVGATHPDVLKELRRKYDRLFFLVPGYGAQGGAAHDVQYAFDRYGHGAIINASRSLMCAWKKTGNDGADYTDAAQKAAIEMRNEITTYVQVM
jgi:orotidine-5'-phosphate decarboxylase